MMKAIRHKIAVARGELSTRSGMSRPRVRRRPECENLEGRQLLSTAASTLASGVPPWGNPGPFPNGSGGPPPAAHFARFNGQGGPGGSGGMGTPDFAHGDKSGSFAPKAMSATLKADLTTLQNDEAQLKSEIPSSVTAAVTADQATISKALGSLPRPKLDGKPMTPPSAPSSTSPPDMTKMLEEAGISAAEAAQIATDFQTYQTDLQTTDPTLQAKITADKAAIKSDGGPSLPAGEPGFGFPGPPMNGQPSA